MSEQKSIDWHKGFQMGLYSGKTVERERIIKLIDEECCELEDCRCSIGIKFAIALINGENK